MRTLDRQQTLAQYQCADPGTPSKIRWTRWSHNARRANAGGRADARHRAPKALGLQVSATSAASSSLLDVLDAERGLLDAQLNRVDAQRAQLAATADLFKALGGGWTAEGVAAD